MTEWKHTFFFRTGEELVMRSEAEAKLADSIRLGKEEQLALDQDELARIRAKLAAAEGYWQTERCVTKAATERIAELEADNAQYFAIHKRDYDDIINLRAEVKRQAAQLQRCGELLAPHPELQDLLRKLGRVP